MEFDEWHHDLFENTYPCTELAPGLKVSYHNEVIELQWGGVTLSVTPQQLWESVPSADDAAADLQHWAYVNFPVRHELEKENSFLCFHSGTGSYTAYVLRGDAVVQAVYGADPRKWMSTKSVTDFHPVVRDTLEGSLICFEQLTAIPAASAISYPYVLQSMVENHLDYDKGYHLAVPSEGRGRMFIGHRSSIERLLLDYDPGHFQTSTLKQALKEHYERTK